MQRRTVVPAVLAVAAALVITVLVLDGGDAPSTSVAASGGGESDTSTTVDAVLMDEPTTVAPAETTVVTEPAAPTTAAPRAPEATVPPPTTTTTAPWVPPPYTCAPPGPPLTTGTDLLAIGDADGLHELRLDGTVDRTIAGTNGINHHDSYASWEPDGRRVVYQVRPADWPYKSQLFVVDLQQGCWRPVTPDDGAAYDLPIWSPAGLIGYRRSTGAGTAAFAPDKAMLEAVSATDPTKKTTFVHGVFGPHWAPDGSGRIAFADAAGLKLFETSTGKVSMLHATTLGVPSIEWSPDARSIAFAVSAHYRVFVVPADGSKPALDVSPPDTWQSLSPSWSPDSTELAFSAAPRSAPEPPATYRDTELWVVKADGSGARTVTSLRNVTLKAYWSPDGRRIAFRQRVDGPPNAPPTYDVTVVDLAGGTPPVVVAKNATLLGFFRRAG